MFLGLQMERRMRNHWPNAREKGRYHVSLVLGFYILIFSFQGFRTFVLIF
jgi:hypothetical protein